MAIRAFDPREKSSQMTSAQTRVESKRLDDLENRLGKLSASIDTRLQRQKEELLSEMRTLMQLQMEAMIQSLEKTEVFDEMHVSSVRAAHSQSLEKAEVFDEMPESTVQSNYSDFLRTLVVTVHETSCPVTVDTLHQIFDIYGLVEEIDILPTMGTFQALVRYKSLEHSISAMYSLHNRCMYEGCCWLDIKYLSYTFLEEVLGSHNWVEQIRSESETKLKVMYEAVKKIKVPCKLEPRPVNTLVSSIMRRESSVDVGVVYSIGEFEESSGDNFPNKTVAKELRELATEKLGSIGYVEILKEDQPAENQQLTIGRASHVSEWRIKEDEIERDYDNAFLDHKSELIHILFDPGGGSEGKNEALENSGNDLTELSMCGKPNSIIGQDGKTRRCIEILSRHAKTNHVLISELGVVKIGNVELAQMIISGSNNIVRLHFLGELLRLIIQQKKMIFLDKNAFSALFTSLLSLSSDNHLVQQAIKKRFIDSLLFMLHYALGFSMQTMMKLLSIVKGVGRKILYMLGVRSRLNDLLKRCHRYYLGDQLRHELSNGEVDVLCLLLGSCTKPTSPRVGYDFEEFIFEVLWVNGAEHPGVLKSCFTILRKLSSRLYGDGKSEAQELMLRSLLVLFRSTNGVVQNLTTNTLLRINLNCSIIGRALDSNLNQKADSMGLARGKDQLNCLIKQPERPPPPPEPPPAE